MQFESSKVARSVSKDAATGRSSYALQGEEETVAGAER